MRNRAALAIFGALCSGAAAADRITISVLLFDYARVPAGVLEPAMRESKRILESAGIELVWTECPVIPERLSLDASCRDTPGPLTLVLHILPQGASRRQTEPNAFGFAAPAGNGGLGTYACVFHDRIEELGATISKTSALGHVIAHELGHLLLGVGHHSAGGIMKADWRRDHLILAAQGTLNFDAGERHRIFENVQRRSLLRKRCCPGPLGSPDETEN